jgi:ferredoxin-nitrite reductase
MRFISDVIKEFDIELIHGTTCQTIQLHNLEADVVPVIMEMAQSAGIYTKGGGGDHPRNVMCSPLTGVEKDGYFDVACYARAAAEYLTELDDSIKLPRKLKVCFSSSPKNEVHATYRDMGFVAREDGLFDLYTAGGLGNGPKLGLLTGEGLEPADILTYIKAMVLTFTENGNYTNRMRSRTRFMRDELGDEGYIAAFNRNLELARAERLHRVRCEAVKLKSGIKGDVCCDRIYEQNTEGLYYVKYHPLGSNFSPKTIEGLAKVMEDYGLIARLIPSGGMYIINCTATEAKAVYDITADSGVSPIECSTACVGQSICQIGLQDSQELLREIIKAVKEAELSAKALPSVHISGCTSSCGTHQTNGIGFQGRLKKGEDGITKPAFALFIGGADRQGYESLGAMLGIVFKEDIPAMLVEIGKAVDGKGMDYYRWVEQNRDELEQIVNKYL